MEPRTLIATVGLPRSGKSTWARNQGCPVVCPDEIRLALHGQRFAPEAEPFVWAIAKVMVRALFASGSRVVILDATNMTRKRRDEWQSKEWRTAFKLFPATVETCVGRAAACGRFDLQAVIQRMAGEFTPIGFGEDVWEGVADE